MTDFGSLCNLLSFREQLRQRHLIEVPVSPSLLVRLVIVVLDRPDGTKEHTLSVERTWFGTENSVPYWQVLRVAFPMQRGAMTKHASGLFRFAVPLLYIPPLTTGTEKRHALVVVCSCYSS